MISELLLLLGAMLGLVDPPAERPADPVAEAAQKQKIRINPASLPPLKDWREKSAPECVPMMALRGLVISHPDSIDFALADRHYVRAKLKKGCAAVDFYSGIYIKPSTDGMICEDRDVIQSRAGTSCMIGKFKTLVPGS